MMKTPSAKKPPKRYKFVDTILIKASNLETVPAGKFYSVFKKRDDLFIFNANAKMLSLKEPDFKWEGLDLVVMIVRVTSSNLDSITPGGVYRVFDDVTDDERYIFDDEGEKVLFDRNIFKCEII